MATALQSSVIAKLSAQQQRSLRALQNKVENRCGYATHTTVSDAQMRALQAAFDAGKASGVPIPPEALAAAAKLGLK
jgi:hypothetical protein